MKKAVILDKSTISRQFTRDPENSPSFSNYDENLSQSSQSKAAGSTQSQEEPLNVQSATYKPHLPARSTVAANRPIPHVAINPLPRDLIDKPRRHMYSKASDRSAAINERIERMARKWTDPDDAPCSYEELSHPTRPSQDKMIMVGRIVCDSDAKLNENSVLLESSRSIGSGARVALNLSTCPAFSLFPGQIVMVEGVNPDGNCLHVTRFLQPANPLFKIPKVPQIYGNYQNFPDAVMSLIVASGPFTLDSRSDLKELDYSPLDSLLSAVCSKRPEVLILCGPFVDSENSSLRDGRLVEMPDRIFELEIIERLKELKQKCPGIQVVLVPSLKDLHSSLDFIYPQSPLQVKTDPSIHFVANPSTFCINEICFTVTNNDVILPLAQQSISRSSSDRLTRICGHLLEQASLYPLMPPGNGANLDFSLLPEIELNFTPDVIITPSTLGAFARAIDSDAVCLNPGQLCRKGSMGTAALLSFSAPKAAGEADCVAERLRVDFIQF